MKIFLKIIAILLIVFGCVVIFIGILGIVNPPRDYWLETWYFGAIRDMGIYGFGSLCVGMYILKRRGQKLRKTKYRMRK